MRESIRTLVTSDGYRLHVRQHEDHGDCHGVVVALHGIQSHSGWYEQSSRAIAAAGLPVTFCDRRGSGLNQAQRGHADHGWRLIHDVRQVIGFIRRERGPSVPIILLAVSWGAKIAAALAATSPKDIDGLALLYPGLEPVIQPTWWQTRQLMLARHLDVRHHRVAIPLSDPALFTDSRSGQAYIRNDALAIHDVTTGLLNAGRDLDLLLRRHASAIRHPTLLMLAGRDRIIDNQRTRRRVGQFGIRHLTTVMFPDACHTLEFEAEETGFIPVLTGWLRDCAAGRFAIR